MGIYMAYVRRIKSKWYACASRDTLAGHGKPVDWWTLGILIYEMIVGYPPFLDDDPLGIYQKILSGKYVFPKFFDK